MAPAKFISALYCLAPPQRQVEHACRGAITGIFTVSDWMRYMSTLLLSGSGGAGFDAKEVPEDGDSLLLCPCVSRTQDGYTEAGEENSKIQRLYSNNGETTYQYVNSLPSTRTISTDQTVFKLYTRNGPKNGTRVYADDVSTLALSGFDKTKPTVVATHGYLSNDHTEWMMQLITAQLFAADCNLISIDWSECANNCCYFGARDCAIAVGGYLEGLLQALVAWGADPARFHLMGHSLGAHLVSQASANGLQVGRITGFDPPQWGFHLDDWKHRLDPQDATFVDVIHTTSTLGWNEVLGHLDFFPNSAGRQPGCSIFNTVCGHSMSYFYYIQSLYNNHKYPAKQCQELDLALSGECNGSIAYMGVSSTSGLPGIYYIKVDEPATGDP